MPLNKEAKPNLKSRCSLELFEQHSFAKLQSGFQMEIKDKRTKKKKKKKKRRNTVEK